MSTFDKCIDAYINKRIIDRFLAENQRYWHPIMNFTTDPEKDQVVINRKFIQKLLDLVTN